MSRQTRGILAVVVLSAISAIFGIISRYLSASFGLFSQLAIRISLTSLLGIILFHGHIRFSVISSLPRSEWLLLILRVAVFTGAATLWVKATLITKIANVTFIDALPASALLGVLILGERLTLKKTVLVLGAFFGVSLIVVRNGAGFTGWGLGEVFAVLSTFLFAFRNISRRFHRSNLSDIEITILMFTVMSLFFWILALLSHESLPVTGWGAGIFIAFGIGALLNLLNLFLINYAYARIPAILAGTVGNLEALFGLVIGYTVYTESPTFQELFGGAVLVASVVLMYTIRERKQPVCTFGVEGDTIRT